jgi:hypothetical protein
VVGLLIEIRPTSTVSYPFASVDLAPGDPIEASIEWRSAPMGLLPMWDRDPTGPAAIRLTAGDPVLPSSIGTIPVPSGWWAVEIPIPGTGTVGTELRVILADGRIIEGVVVEAPIDNGFETVGMGAFAPNDAPLVATAAINDALTVMVGMGPNEAASSG